MEKSIIGNSHRLGILGGGQLGRMFIQEAINYNVHVHIMDNNENVPSFQICSSFTKGVITNYNDVLAFGKTMDVLTVEIENVNVDALYALEKLGVKIFPQPRVLEIINDKKSNVGVNTHLANRIVEEAIEQKIIKEIKNYSEYQREVKFGLHSRFDFQLKNKTKKAFLEVKNVTLSRQSRIAEFPDAVTSRGLKHLEELEKAIKKGYESFLIYLVQREDCKEFRIAKDIDPKYYEGFLKAKKNGVKFISYSCKVNEKEIYVNKPIKIVFK